MDDTGVVKLRTHRVTFWAVVVAVSGIALALAGLTAASMHTTAITAETQSARVEPAPSATGDTIPAAFEIKPAPVIEPDPVFFIGAGDGSNGYYAGRPAR